MTKKGAKKKDVVKGEKTRKTDSQKLDEIIKVAEAMLKATEKHADLTEIRSMFTAMRGFTEQTNKHMGNLESAFTAVIADLQELKTVLGARPANATPAAPGPALVFTSIDVLPLADHIKKKLHAGERENGKRVIRCDWLGDNWKPVNKLVRQMGFKWIKDEQNTKNSRWVEQ